MKKILTIIVPSYKTAPFIDECLPTFIDKRFFDCVDILLIDDGTPDKETIEKLTKYHSEYPDYFHYIHKENGGHGSVINCGVKLVNTKYFKVIDGDDWINPDEMAKLLDFLYDCDDDIVVNNYAKIIDGKIEKVECGPLSQQLDTKGIHFSQIGNYLFALHSVTFKTSLWTSNNITIREKTFYEDQEYCLFPLEFATSFAFSESCVYQYRLGREGQSVDPKSLSRHFEDIYLVSNDCLDLFFRLKDRNESVAQYIGKRFANIREFCLTVIFDDKKSNDVSKNKMSNLHNYYSRIKSDPFLTKSLKKRKDRLTKMVLLLGFKSLYFLQFLKK